MPMLLLLDLAGSQHLLDGCFDEASEVEDEEDKAAKQDDTGEELALLDEGEDDREEEDGQRADGYGVGK
ncbi:uncharacterized protein KY384_005740 [Bacidia gigantensis]|uniref:uncharacterized protein n=1 Tax=Bacidia gigantensis TaxID=2732470 RepID=UPI001D04E342|nr:uncharacterized protein KY384_005740 [Bacidia gigantensis]KAG8529105.1 hypothetical protein KY384_005740 [Bacidia gigantensis]